MNLGQPLKYQNLKRNCYQKLTVCLMSAVIFLLGCSEQSEIETLPQKDVVQKESNDIAKGKQFIRPTIISSNKLQREKLLLQLAITSSSSFEDKRLALFVRYTLLVNDPKPQLEVLNKIINELTGLVAQSKDDVELRALLGSATTFQSIFYAEDSGKQRLLSKKGSRLMDRAVRDSPNHLGVRLQRGISYASMPAFLGKARYAVDDLSIIKSFMHDDNSDFDAMIDFYLGMGMFNNKQTSQGRQILEQLVVKKLQPWSQKASSLIEEKG